MVKQVGGKRTSRRGDPEAAPFHISARTWGAGERRVRFGQRIYCLSLNPKEGEVITRCRVIRTETSWMEIGTTGELPGLTAVLWCANLGTWCCIFTTYLQTLCVATHKFYPLVAYLWGWVVIHLITPAPYGFTKLPDNHGSCRETSKARKTQIKRGHTTLEIRFSPFSVVISTPRSVCTHGTNQSHESFSFCLRQSLSAVNGRCWSRQVCLNHERDWLSFREVCASEGHQPLP